MMAGPTWGADLGVGADTVGSIVSSAATGASSKLKDPTASDVAGIIGKGAGAGSAIVGPLLMAAGTASAVPVVGWIAAGGAAAAAGTIALVGALRKAKIRKSEAVAMAKKMGMPDAEKVPAFTVKAIRLAKDNPQRLVAIGTHLHSQLHAKKTKKGIGAITHGITHPGSLLKTKKRLSTKLALIGAVLAWSFAEKSGHATESSPDPALVQESSSLSLEHAFEHPGILIGGLGLTLLVVILLRRKSQ